MLLVLGTVLLVVALVAIALQRLYSSMPARELKRLAARHDQLAGSLFAPVAYGASLRLLLWGIAGPSFAAGVVLVIHAVSGWLAFAIILAVAMASFVIVPTLHLTVRSARFAGWFSRPLASVLHRLHPFLDRAAQLLNRYRALEGHSGLFEKEDIRLLLEQQRDQVDNRIEASDIELIQRALRFVDKTAADIIRPRTELRLVEEGEAIGPVLLEELHRTKQTHFVVYKSKPEQLTGTLSLQEAVAAKHGGRIADVMHRDIAYVNESFTLSQVLQAFLIAEQPLVIVINNFEEMAGVITFRQLVQQLLGEQADSFVAYQDRTAVAAWKPEPVPPEAAAAGILAEEMTID
jgi:CBS domain containing-hemolysin-like protein